MKPEDMKIGLRVEVQADPFSEAWSSGVVETITPKTPTAVQVGIRLDSGRLVNKGVLAKGTPSVREAR